MGSSSESRLWGIRIQELDTQWLVILWYVGFWFLKTIRHTSDYPSILWRHFMRLGHLLDFVNVLLGEVCLLLARDTLSRRRRGLWLAGLTIRTILGYPALSKRFKTVTGFPSNRKKNFGLDAGRAREIDACHCGSSFQQHLLQWCGIPKWYMLHKTS